MTPSSRFSYIRPNRNIRSTPSSPQLNECRIQLQSQGLSPRKEGSDQSETQEEERELEIPSGPPILPPIARVSSHLGLESVQDRQDVQRSFITDRSRPEGSHTILHNTWPSTLSRTPSPPYRSSESRPFPSERYSMGNRTSRFSFRKAASSADLGGESRALPSEPTYRSYNDNTNNSRRSKSKLSLLNPISILKRRRASKNMEYTPEAVTSSRSGMEVPAMSVPDDYDPRIRGIGVHDFNAPRSLSSDRRPSIPYSAREQPVSPERSHTPVFTEQFEENGNSNISAIHRESLANSAFISRQDGFMNHNHASQGRFDHGHEGLNYNPTVGRTESQLTKDVYFLPVSANSSDLELQTLSSGNVEKLAKSREFDPEKLSVSRSRNLNSTAASSNSSPGDEVQPSMARDGPRQPSDLHHISSTASRVSRFSFQLNSDHSNAQEKAMEEKARNRNAQKAIKPQPNRDSRFDDFDEEEQDYDDMDDGGFEEEIPEVGGDYDAMPSAMNTNRITSPSDGSSSHGSPYRTYLANHQMQTLDLSSETPRAKQRWSSDYEDPTTPVGISTPPTAIKLSSSTSTDYSPLDNFVLDDDFYYDNGEFGTDSHADETRIDEELFDSPMHERYDRRADDDVFQERLRSGENEKDAACESSERSAENEISKSLLLHPSIELTGPENEPAELTEYNIEQNNEHNSIHMDAYHSALATAANKAAQNGKFQRMPPSSISLTHSTEAEGDDFDFKGIDDYRDQAGSGFDDDYDLGDDPMIAAANADVLASDDSEYYGVEYGFYGHPAAPEAQSFSGGYFGTNPEAMSRHLSGHNVSREPNLTPITERSEFSRRTSYISMGQRGLSSLSISNPRDVVLTSPQLRDLHMGYESEDMSMEQLRKLRRETFGSGASAAGSNRNSFAGSTSSINSSPTGLMLDAPFVAK